MKLRYPQKLTRLFTIGIILCTTTALVAAVRIHSQKTVSVGQPIHSRIKKFNDPKLIAAFERISASIRMDGDFDYAGILNINDGADTSMSLKNMDFICSRKGMDCYTKFGHSEMLNAHGVYLFIEHDQKKVWLSPQKAISTPLPLNTASFNKNLISEDYQISAATEGSDSTIRLINEHHLSCKEYAISYDTTSKQVNHIYARLTNFQHPENDGKDKVVEMQLFHWSETGMPEKYLRVDDVIRIVHGVARLTNKYNDYELLNLR